MDIKQKEKDRQSHTGMYGSPKKGGAGGKGTWGIGGLDDLKQVSTTSRDPNYNSEDEEDEVILEKVDVISPVEAIIKEYLAEGDAQDTAKSLKEHPNVSFTEFIRKCMVLSMERQPFERELVSKLLSALYAKVIPPEVFSEGFQQALDVLEDVVLDCPSAGEMLGKFIARAIVDEVIPPAFLNTAFAESKLSKDAIALAHGLVTDNHRSKKLEHIWGPGDLESVKRLKEEASLLIEEYLVSGDLNEADRCVRKLNAPHFYFQVVKQALRMALQKPEDQRKKILSLLSFFSTKGTGLLTPDHMRQGFKICKESLEDIKLDAPAADKIFPQIVQTAKSEGWLEQFD